MIERLEHIPLGWLYLALIAAGSLVGALCGLISLIDWPRRRRT
jgi:hypothetical protein